MKRPSTNNGWRRPANDDDKIKKNQKLNLLYKYHIVVIVFQIQQDEMAVSNLTPVSFDYTDTAISTTFLAISTYFKHARMYSGIVSAQISIQIVSRSLFAIAVNSEACNSLRCSMVARGLKKAYHLDGNIGEIWRKRCQSHGVWATSNKFDFLA